MLFFMLLMCAFCTQAKHYNVLMRNYDNKLGNMVFIPSYLKLEKGDTVTFVPVDGTHNSQSVFIPKGAKKWEGEINKPITVTFEVEGVYIYLCIKHWRVGHLGVIQVGQANNREEAKIFSKKLRKKIVRYRKRFDNTMKNITTDSKSSETSATVPPPKLS